MTARALMLAVAAILVVAAAPAPPTVRALAARLDAVGAKPVVDELDGHEQFDAVLDRIATGSAGWIALAPRLAPGTDGANGLGLRVALAHALLSNPAAVLRATELSDNPVLGTKLVCGIPFIEVSQAYIRSYRRRGLTALSRVRNGDLLAKRDQCRVSLAAP